MEQRIYVDYSSKMMILQDDDDDEQAKRYVWSSVYMRIYVDGPITMLPRLHPAPKHRLRLL